MPRISEAAIQGNDPAPIHHSYKTENKRDGVNRFKDAHDRDECPPIPKNAIDHRCYRIPFTNEKTSGLALPGKGVARNWITLF